MLISREQERHRADVVFVAVGQDQRADVLAVLLEVSEIGRDDVDAQQFGFGEHHPGVDDDDVVAVAQGHAVHAELAQPAERDHLQFCIWHRIFRLTQRIARAAREFT